MSRLYIVTLLIELICRVYNFYDELDGAQAVIKNTKVDVFLEPSCFFDDPTDVGDLISSSSAFSKTSMYIYKFTVHILLKPGLENFEHYFTSV